jgi:signal transduction histidine kinase
MQKTGGSIMLSSERKDDKMVLTVRDDGPGIPEEIQHNLFDAFSTSGKNEGVGLGLVVTRNIINAHGGEICFDSEPGRGTTFKIYLPAPSA